MCVFQRDEMLTLHTNVTQRRRSSRGCSQDSAFLRPSNSLAAMTGTSNKPESSLCTRARRARLTRPARNLRIKHAVKTGNGQALQACARPQRTCTPRLFCRAPVAEAQTFQDSDGDILAQALEGICSSRRSAALAVRHARQPEAQVRAGRFVGRLPLKNNPTLLRGRRSHLHGSSQGGDFSKRSPASTLDAVETRQAVPRCTLTKMPLSFPYLK